jgi:signal transduction histidine kinase
VQILKYYIGAIRLSFQSTIFRLTLAYAAFFFVSVFLLLTFVYFATVREMESQIKHRINAQTNQVQMAFNAHGAKGVEKQINEFLEEEDEGLSLYLLVDNQNKVLAGNMEAWPEDVEYSESWILFDIESHTDKNGVHVLARDVPLAGGYRLMVGYSLHGPDRARKAMLDVVLASIVLSFLITALGGAFFSGVIKNRLGRVNDICAQVIAGNLDVKVPITGGADQFDYLGMNVNAMLHRIAELVNGLKQTSDNIAHDLRTPLGRHRIRLEGLVNHPPRISQMHDTIKAGIEEVDSILETLNSILRISQAQSGVASGHFITFDLSSIMIDVVEFYAEFAEQKGIVMDYYISEDIKVTGDKPLITQAIANLIDNAIKYTSPGGLIHVQLTATEQGIECIVADNGPGIPPEYYSKVKERFFRLEASRTSPGTGLGLSLVDAVAKLHHGELVFGDNQPGLKVIFKLPSAALAAAFPPAS